MDGGRRSGHCFQRKEGWMKLQCPLILLCWWSQVNRTMRRTRLSALGNWGYNGRRTGGRTWRSEVMGLEERDRPPRRGPGAGVAAPRGPAHPLCPESGAPLGRRAAPQYAGRTGGYVSGRAPGGRCPGRGRIGEPMGDDGDGLLRRGRHRRDRADRPHDRGARSGRRQLGAAPGVVVGPLHWGAGDDPPWSCWPGRRRC